MKDIEKRIREIVAEISAITEFAEGSIAANSKQCTLKNGTVRRASPQYMHWRHENAARVCAIIARLRSMA